MTRFRGFGFEEGRIFGTRLRFGTFHSALMPDKMHERSQVTALKLIPSTARLAKTLYPDADIRHQPFEETSVADGFYDVAISNIPFGDYKPFDPRLKKWNFVIHDYFFASSLEKVRPGGLILFVTSRGTIRQTGWRSPGVRSQQADLLGAIRLPNTALSRTPTTEVTTDIVDAAGNGCPANYRKARLGRPSLKLPIPG